MAHFLTFFPLRFALLVVVASGFIIPRAGAQEQYTRMPFKYRAETQFRYSSDRRLNASQIWQPIWSVNDDLIYATLRSMVDNLDNFEGNIGLGARRFLGDHIWGGYGYIDRRRTALGSDFWQTTWGAEYIRDDVEARANIYIPFNATRTFSYGSGGAPYLAGTGVYVRAPGTLTEEAQAGADAEIGFTLPDTSDFVGQTRVYGGGYYFHGNHTQAVAGVRTRLETNVTDWLKLGGRAQYDDERGAQYFVEATFRWPPLKKARSQGLWARMSDMPERDVDIVTGETATPGAASPVIDMATGQPVRFIYVDNAGTSGGDGSAEHPFTALSAALEIAQAHDIVYIQSGNGTPAGYDEGYRINTGDVTVIGSGSPLTLDGSRYRSSAAQWEGDLILRARGDYPLITSLGGDALTLAGRGITIKGVHIDGSGGHGVVITNGADDVVLENLRVTGNAGNGVFVTQSTPSEIHARLRESVIIGNLLSGVRTETSGGGVHLDMGQNGDYGFNDVYGNIGTEVSAQTGGVPLPAVGNFWGGGGLTDLTGPHQGLVDGPIAVASPFCPDCMIPAFNFESQTGAREGTRAVTSRKTLTGFTGHRYIQVSGDGTPSFQVNGVDTGLTLARVGSGDQVAIALNTKTTGFESQHVILTGGVGTETLSVQTRFLPNYLGTLIGWWDGQDIDGDFDTGDNPASGTLIDRWADKTGFGHNGISAGTQRPSYDRATSSVMMDAIDDELNIANSFYLSALNNGMSLAAVFSGTGGAGGATLFDYGTCTNLASSRCLRLTQNGASDNGTLRLDTDAGAHQNMIAHNLFDGGTHMLWMNAHANGTATIRLDGQVAATGTYQTGGGFWNAGGLSLGQALGGSLREVLLFNGTPGNDARDLIEDYLTTRWGL